MFRSLTLGLGTLGGVIAGVLSADAWYLTTTPGAAHPSPFLYLILWPASFVLIGSEKMTQTGAVITHLVLIVCNGLIYGAIGWVIISVRAYLLRP